MIDVDKGIPVPNLGSHGRSVKYPFRTMAVGESFFAPDMSTTGLITAARHYRPSRFTCRKVVENGVKGARCWRVL